MRLGFATSTDGLEWEVISGSGANGSVVDLGDDGAFDELAVQWPAVIHTGTMFELWYQGLGFLHPTSNIVPRVGCARSEDGISWQKVPDSASEAGECFRTLGQPSVILEDDVYKMWYALSGLNPNDDVVMYATSEKANTAVGQDELPVLVSSLAVYPNPASSQVKVRFSLSRPGILAMEVRDLLGREVRSINLGHRAAGEHIVLWSGLDVGNAPVPAGAYIVSILNRETGLRSSGGIVQVVH
jgi:hypothetical protein